MKSSVKNINVSYAEIMAKVKDLQAQTRSVSKRKYTKKQVNKDSDSALSMESPIEEVSVIKNDVSDESPREPLHEVKSFQVEPSEDVAKITSDVAEQVENIRSVNQKVIESLANVHHKPEPQAKIDAQILDFPIISETTNIPVPFAHNKLNNELAGIWGTWADEPMEDTE